MMGNQGNDRWNEILRSKYPNKAIMNRDTQLKHQIIGYVGIEAVAKLWMIICG
jgi:hypothetical protein